MKITKYSPISTSDLMGFSDMPVRFSELMDNFFNDAVAFKAGSFNPNVEISEDDKSYYINVELPGLNKEDIKVNLEKNDLTISGERKFENKEENRKYHLVESGYGTFSRTFRLDDAVDKDTIKASFENGILKLVLTKKETELSRQIEVK